MLSAARPGAVAEALAVDPAVGPPLLPDDDDEVVEQATSEVAASPMMRTIRAFVFISLAPLSPPSFSAVQLMRGVRCSYGFLLPV